MLKRILTWWYHRKLRKNETQLAKLKKERSKILDDVMNTETYKVAKDILDKYGPVEQLKPREPIKVRHKCASLEADIRGHLDWRNRLFLMLL